MIDELLAVVLEASLSSFSSLVFEGWIIYSRVKYGMELARYVVPSSQLASLTYPI